MNPRHIDNITAPNRRAIAPYNFVELPEKVVEAQPLPDQNCYHDYSEHLINGETLKIKRHTGRIECTLTTESPLYTRCGWSPEDFAKYSEPPKNMTQEEKDKWEKERKEVLAAFFAYSKNGLPVIAGSSIRGMLRTLVEIVSFSKIDRVSGHQRLFFRAVGSNPKKESWGKEYKKYVDPIDHEKIKAGYLTKQGEKWYIQAACEDKSVTFSWVEESDLTNIAKFKSFNDNNYEPQYFNVTYDSNSLKRKEIKRNGIIVARPWFVSNIELQDSDSSSKLVTSGNMKQTEDGNSPRCNHCIVFPVDKKAKLLPIDNTAIEHYRNALTDFQKDSPFDKDWGVLEEDRPVFYYHDGKSETVGFFGQSPNFRIPYSPEGNGHATTVLDFIPENLRELASIDLADAIFGWVKQESENEKLPKGFDKQRAGRVFVTDALYQNNQNGIWYSEKPVTPQILSEPKSSYFPHYLVQPDADKLELKHYASQPVEETVIRGHKLYWHKGSNPDFKQKVLDTQTTEIKPINKGITFKFYIHFENLSDVELGALLWVLSLSSDKSQQLGIGKQEEKYCFSLGMGKPLGMGAVKIDYQLHLSDRTARYNQLFDGDTWKTGADNQTDTAKYVINAFEKHIIDEICCQDYPKDHTREQLQHLNQLPRIEMLLAMLQCDEHPKGTHYMELDDFKHRKVLPTPLDIRNIEDKRRFTRENNICRKTESASKPKPQKNNNGLKKEPENKVNLALQRPPKPPKRKS